jgi:hypothetical protein
VGPIGPGIGTSEYVPELEWGANDAVTLDLEAELAANEELLASLGTYEAVDEVAMVTEAAAGPIGWIALVGSGVVFAGVAAAMAMALEQQASIQQRISAHAAARPTEVPTIDQATRKPSIMVPVVATKVPITQLVSPSLNKLASVAGQPNAQSYFDVSFGRVNRKIRQRRVRHLYM